ncbi:MAG TPA: hypothetical protein VG795_15780 [Acidimicrobiia bacterium]|nr:hypothetical protein [Acidimicrobiia bacterium]
MVGRPWIWNVLDFDGRVALVDLGDIVHFDPRIDLVDVGFVAIDVARHRRRCGQAVVQQGLRHAVPSRDRVHGAAIGQRLSRCLHQPVRRSGVVSFGRGILRLSCTRAVNRRIAELHVTGGESISLGVCLGGVGRDVRGTVGVRPDGRFGDAELLSDLSRRLAGGQKALSDGCLDPGFDDHNLLTNSG